jgi:triosephosphate isomerase (TIM)
MEIRTSVKEGVRLPRRKILIGNWKMYKTVAEARAFAEELGRHSNALTNVVDYAICPPFTALHILRVVLPANVGLGAQNMHYAPHGAFTGEISADMVKELGATYVILGHSERRNLFGEDDPLIQQKVNAAVQAGLVPILCVGEDLQQRELNQTLTVVRRQTEAGIQGLSPEQVAAAIIAYEPVWAIGSGLTPSPDQAQEVISYIRSVVAEVAGPSAAEGVRILYGGSVKPENIASFVQQPDIDGALVGGASLDPHSFVEMARAIAGGTEQ